jgi:hypothetical protein
MNRITAIVIEEAKERYIAYAKQIMTLENDGHPIQEPSDEPQFYAELSFELARIGVCGDCLVQKTS